MPPAPPSAASRAAPGGGKKHPWLSAEDALLRDAFMRVSSSHAEPLPWGRVAEHVPTRTAKQCRERWVHHLAPAVSKAPWTEAEDAIIYSALTAQRTRKWAYIATLLPGRTDHCVKNRYYSSMRKASRAARSGRGQPAAAAAAAASAGAGGAGQQQQQQEEAEEEEEVEEEEEEEEHEGGQGSGLQAASSSSAAAAAAAAPAAAAGRGVKRRRQAAGGRAT
jgi:hypothetical protein